MKKIRVCIAQMLVEFSKPEKNLQRAKNTIQESSKKDCSVVLLPETMDIGWTNRDALNLRNLSRGSILIF